MTTTHWLIIPNNEGGKQRTACHAPIVPGTCTSYGAEVTCQACLDAVIRVVCNAVSGEPQRPTAGRQGHRTPDREVDGMSTTISVPTTARVTFGLLAYLPRFGTHVNLEWDSREPYAVAFAFEQPGGVTVTRHADREVLSRVSNDRAAHTHGFAAYLALGRAVLAWDAEVVVSIDGGMLGRFLLTTYAACPLGAEDVDVDGLIAQILEETP